MGGIFGNIGGQMMDMRYRDPSDVSAYTSQLGNQQQPKTFLTPQEQVQQSQANGGILRIRGQQPGLGQMPGNAFMGKPVEYAGQQIPGGAFMGKPVEYAGQQMPGNAFMGKPVEYAGQQMPGNAFMGKPVEYSGQMGGGMTQQGNQQYYQQMRESMLNMDKALKELEGIQTPGGQYNAVGGMGQGNTGK
jgi:hypothetical protein